MLYYFWIIVDETYLRFVVVGKKCHKNKELLDALDVSVEVTVCFN